MKKKMYSMLSKTRIVVFALVCIIVSMLFLVNGNDEVQAEDSTSVVLDTKSYDYAIATFTGETDIAKVKDCLDNNKVPEVEGTTGYLFAGWFKNTDCAKSNAIRESSEVQADGIYYAKFMPEDVLSVKAQISTTASAAGTRNMRFVSSVESLVYNRVGFMLQYEENGETVIKYNNSKDVFEKIKTATEGDEYEYSPKVVDTESEYFITATWTDISDFDLGFYVRAYWKTLDGVVVYGPSRYVCVNDGLTSTIVNLPVKDADKTLEVYTEENQTIYNVTYNDSSSATAKVVYHDGEYAHLRIELGSARTSLNSVTTFKVQNLSAKHRNLNTKYTGTSDKTWYTAYKNADGTLEETEFVIATSADLYGLASIVNDDSVSFKDKTIYVVSDITVNIGRATQTGWSKTDEDGTAIEDATSYTWKNIGNTKTKSFQGTFDGQGHTIKGINGKNTRGLFANASGCTIKDFCLEDSYFSSESSGGSIVGVFDGTLESVSSNAFIENTYSAVGGIVGQLSDKDDNATSKAIIRDCWFSGSITATYTGGNGVYYGGIVGQVLKGTEHEVSYTLFTGSMTITNNGSATSIKSTNVGGIIGGGKCKVANCLNNGTLNALSVSDEEHFPKKIGNISGSNATVEKSYSMVTWGDSDSAIIPTETVNSHESYINMSELDYYTKSTPNGYWVVREDAVPALQTFTDQWIDVAWYYDNIDRDSYSIATAQELYGLSVLSQQNSFEGKTINLTNDIVMNFGKATDWAAGKNLDNLRNWTPIGMVRDYPFEGIFEGNGYTISGIYCKLVDGMTGFIGRLSGGALQNIQLKNSYVSRAGSNVGGAVGYFYGGKVNSVYCDAIVNQTAASGRYVGGIVGFTGKEVEVTNCWFAGTVKSSGKDVGGIVGYVNAGSARITDCLMTGKVLSDYTKSEMCTGGIVGGCGQANWYLTRCLMAGQMNAADATKTAIAPLVGSPALAAADDSSTSTRTRKITNSYATTAGYTALIGAESNVVLTDSHIVESSQKENVQNLFVEGSTTWTEDEEGNAVLNF